MNSNWDFPVMVVSGFAMLTILSVVGLLVEARKRKHAVPPVLAPLPPPSRTSVLAGLSFLSGLGAVLLVASAAVATATVSAGEAVQLPARVHGVLGMGARIVLYASLVPSVLSAALAIAARGAIAEARGALRGRSLYRTGLVLALICGILAVDSRIVRPGAWAEAGESLTRKAFSWTEGAGKQGYLGIEDEPAGQEGVRVLKVAPGSPADGAGLRPGDRILSANASSLASAPSLADRLKLMKPGTLIVLSVARGDEIFEVTAVLAAPFESLLETLVGQDDDLERLAVLNAAGADRRFSAVELKRICDTFDQDEGRLTAIQAALPRLVDPRNAYALLGSLEGSDSKTTVGAWISERIKAGK